MRKRKRGRKFGREKAQRSALVKSLAAALLQKEKIKTTEAKAKSLAVFVQKQITRAKKDSVQSRRELSKNFSKDIVKKMVSEIAPRYKDRPGGYTRIIKLEPRKSDGARIAIIELIK